MKSLLVLFTRMALISPKYMEGDLRSGENWNFIARFCFLSFHGKFQYDIEYPEVRTEVQSVSQLSGALEVRDYHKDHMPQRTYHHNLDQ